MLQNPLFAPRPPAAVVRGNVIQGSMALDCPRRPGSPSAAHRCPRAMHATFKALNSSMTIPLLRAGLGPWLGSPLGGWLLLLRVRGRKSGLMRDIPLSYLVDDGAAWVMAGFGPGTQWYRNLLADPDVEVILPGRTRRCVAEDVRDPDTRRRILPKLLRATGAGGSCRDATRGTHRSTRCSRLRPRSHSSGCARSASHWSLVPTIRAGSAGPGARSSSSD